MNPLFGQRVVVTRARRQAASLAAAFEAAGATVECLPLIEVTEPKDSGPLERAARRVEDFDWLVMTSTNAVDAFFDRLQAPLPAKVRLAVVGPATASAVRQRGSAPELVAARSDADGLVAEMAPYFGGPSGSSASPVLKVLVPRADDGRPELIEGLQALGARVVAVDAYSKRLPDGAMAAARELFGGADAGDVCAVGDIGWVTFTSPRIARHFAALFGQGWDQRRPEVRAVSIGPVTTRELRSLGVTRISEAVRPSPDEMVLATISTSS